MFCPHCGKEIQQDASINYCPTCGKSLSEDLLEVRKQTVVKLAKFNLSSEILFESCISSVDAIGLTIDKIERVGKYIEAVDGKMAFKDRRTVFHLKVIEAPSNTSSIVRATIVSEDNRIPTDLFNRLIDTLSNKLSQKPTVIEDEIVNKTSMPDRDVSHNQPQLLNKSSNIGRKGSIVLGVILAIWTIAFLAIIIEYNIRLANVAENASGFGAIVVARIAPSIEISTAIALLFIIITILLFVRPKKSSIIALIVLSIVNILLTFLVFAEIPQILSDLVYVLLIGIILNITVLVFSAIKNTKLK